MIITTQDYGQFLINGVNNYTGTYFSKIVEGLEHDSVWRHLNGSKLPSKVIWERVSEDILLRSIKVGVKSSISNSIFFKEISNLKFIKLNFA